MLIKGSTYIEDLSNAEIIALDKTGTLTKGVFEVTKVVLYNEDENINSKEKLIEIVAHAESNSNHPIVKSILKQYGKEVDYILINKIEELSGLGIKAEIDKNEVLVGNSKLLEKFNIEYAEIHKIGTIIYVAINNK